MTGQGVGGVRSCMAGLGNVKHNRQRPEPGGHPDPGDPSSPAGVWPHIHFATTGLNSFGARVNADQQITRQEALRLFTRGNAWFLRMEDRIGTIEPGRLADLAVLDRDYFAVPDREIPRIRAVLTVVDGRVVHEAGSPA